MRYRRIDPFFLRLFILSSLAILLYIIYLLSAVIMPFLVAFVLAYVLNPIVQKLQSTFYIHRWLVILLVYISVILIIGLTLWWIIPLIWEQAQIAWRFIPTIIEWYNTKVITWVGEVSPIKLPMIQAKQMSAGLVEYLRTNYNVTDVSSLFSRLFVSGIGIVNIAGVVFLVPILTFYFLSNWNERLEGWKNAIPKPYVKKVLQITSESHHALMAFIRGQLLVMVLLGVVYAVQLQLIGLNVGLIIGMVSGIASFVPYLGFAIGFISAIVAGFFQFGLDWIHLLLIIGAFLVGQAVEGYVLQPLLLGDKIGLSPLWVMFSVLAGASLMGIVGMLVALPVAAIINILCRHIYQAYINSDFYHGQRQLKLFDD